MRKNVRCWMEYKQSSRWCMLRIEWYRQDGAIAFNAGAVSPDGVGGINFCITDLDRLFCVQRAHGDRIGFGGLDGKLLCKLFGEAPAGADSEISIILIKRNHCIHLNSQESSHLLQNSIEHGFRIQRGDNGSASLQKSRMFLHPFRDG